MLRDISMMKVKNLSGKWRQKTLIDYEPLKAWVLNAATQRKFKLLKFSINKTTTETSLYAYLPEMQQNVL